MVKKQTKTKAKVAPKRRGRPPFAPTAEMRQNVEALSAGGVTINIMREIVINPRTNRPIAIGSFMKYFRRELSTGHKKITGKAVSTIVKAMDGIDQFGNSTSASVNAARFWLATRENELFSERRINETVQQKSEIAELTPEQALRVADNVTKSAGLNDKARKRRRVAKQ